VLVLAMWISAYRSMRAMQAMRAGLAGLVVAWALGLSGCAPADTSCPPLTLDTTSLAAQTSAIDFEVYDASHTCNGNKLDGVGAGAVLSRHVDGNGALTIELAAGTYVIVLRAYDRAGRLIGNACATEPLSAAQHACLSLSLSPPTITPVTVPDAAPDPDPQDLAGVDGGGGVQPDLATPPFVALKSGTTNGLFQVWAAGGGELYVVGDNGTILHSTNSGTSFQQQASGTTNPINAVWGSGPNDVYAVGAAGTLLHRTGTSWQGLSSGTTHDLYDVWGSGAGDVFVVGDRGALLHGTGGALSAMSSGVVTRINCVWGSGASDVYLFGGGGLVMTGSASGFTKRTSGTTDELLYGWGSSGSADVWINSVTGTIYHSANHGQSWTPQLTTAATLWAIWSDPSGHAFIVGDQILETNDHGGHWPLVASPPQILYGVGGALTGGGVWAVGAAGTILYHP